MRAILCSAAVANLAACKKESAMGKPADVSPAPLNLKTAKPARSDILRFVTLPGVVVADQQATLCSKIAGYLKTISVDKGDEVKQGQLLAEVEAPELVADMSRYKAEAEIADLDLKRVTEAHQKAPDLVVIQSLDAAKAKSLTARANLERAETLLGFCRITAPFNGVVTRRNVDPGAFIPAATSSGAAQNAAVVTVADFSKVRVQVAAPELESALIRNGQPALITFEGLGPRVFEAKISRSSQALDDATKTMLVEADLPNEKRELRPGMFATARIGIEKHANALTLPVYALVMEKTAAFVFKTVNGKAKKTPIKVGFNDGARFEIMDGVNEGDAVLLVGKTAIADGTPVNVTEAK